MATATEFDPRAFLALLARRGDGPSFDAPDVGGGFSVASGADAPGAKGPAFTGQSTSLSGMAANAIGSPGKFNLGPVTINPAQIAAKIAMAAVPGVNAIDFLSGSFGKIASLLGKIGVDVNAPSTMGPPSAAQLAAMNQGHDIDSATFANLTQGLGLTPGQLNAISENASFGKTLGTRGEARTLSDALRGLNPDEEFTINTLQNPELNPSFEFDDSSDGSGTGAGTGGTGSGTGTGAGDGSAGGTGGTAGTASAKGGTIRNRRGTTLGTRDSVHMRLMPGEEVTRKSEASKPGVRAALKDINRPGTSALERLVTEFETKHGGARI